MKNLPTAYFEKQVDLIIDNKKWPVPTTPLAKAHLKKGKVRGHLRKPSEGLQDECTKPNTKRNRINPGGYVNVTAGLCGGKIILWEEIKGRWNGEKAAAMYKVIDKAVRKARPHKAQYTVVEDNDPTGYNSSKGKKAKRELKLKVKKLPPYSPDLNPWDFALWKNIDDRVQKNGPKGKETAKAFKKRLRLTALRTSRTVVGNAVRSMKGKIAAVAAAKGGNIKSD